MPARPGAWIACIVLLCGGGLLTAAHADDAEATAAIAKLLEVGWNTTPQARLDTNAQYMEVLKVAGSDPRVPRAAALVLLQQRRYDVVAKQLDLLLEHDPADLEAWRAKVWLATLLKNFPEALLAADKLGQNLPEEAEVTTEAEIAAREYIAFLGRIFGYISGPMVDAANQEPRKIAEKRLLARLSPARQDEFRRARDGVLQRFIEMSDEKQDHQEQVKVAAEAEKERVLAGVEATREANAHRLEELKEQRDKLRSELKAELDEIAKADQPLVGQLAQLSAQSAAGNRTLFNLNNEIALLQNQLSREKDPNLRAILLSQLDGVNFQVARVQGNLNGINRLAVGVTAQRRILFQRQQQANANYGGQLSGLDKEYQDLEKKEKRADADERRAGRPISTTTGKSLALSATATALSTYDQFPLEAAKARLLETLK
jgi:hypothetical protein